ncbi:MFS transporter, partial [Streptomyces sp. NPDC059506]
DRYVLEEMKAGGYALGGEQSGPAPARKEPRMRRRHTAAPGTPAAGTAEEDDGPRPRLTGRTLLTVLGLSLAYSVTAVDPLMLTLNLSRAVLTLDFLSAGLGVVLGLFGGAVMALTPEQVGLLYLPGTLVIAGASVLAGRAVASRTARPVMITGLLMLVASTLVLAGTVSPTMALWLLVLATWTCNLGAFVTSTPVSDTILAHAPQGKAGSVAAVQPTFGMTGYALGPTVYILLLDLFFRKEWLADAESRGLSARQGEQAVDAARSSMANAPGSPGYDPNLVRQVSGLALDLDFTNAVRLTMLTVALAPLAVAVLAYFLMPRRPRPAPGTGREAGPETAPYTAPETAPETGRDATPGTTPGDEPGPGPGPGEA